LSSSVTVKKSGSPQRSLIRPRRGPTTARARPPTRRLSGYDNRSGRRAGGGVMRSDDNRYGLVVIASPKSEKGAYKVYTAAREEDMKSYLISPASGGIYIECFRRDGSKETKELACDRESKRLRID
jgi:hypothetical protein